MRTNHAINLLDTSNLTREQWLQQRIKGIGGSDAAAALGVNKWTSIVDLFNDKTNRVINEDVQSEAAYFGTVLEDTVATEFTLRTTLEVVTNNNLMQHPEHSFMLANIDREGVDVDGEPFVLECKTANSFLKSEWEKGTPDNYVLQVLHYLAVTGYKRAYVACLVGGQSFFIHKIEPTQEDIDELIRREQIFWTYVESDTIPPNIEPNEQFNDIDNLDEEVLTLDNEEIESLILLRANAKDKIKEIKADLKKYEDTIKGTLGNNTTATTSNNTITWKPVITNRFDSKRFKAEHPDMYNEYVKESSYRKFHIGKL